MTIFLLVLCFVGCTPAESTVSPETTEAPEPEIQVVNVPYYKAVWAENYNIAKGTKYPKSSFSRTETIDGNEISLQLKTSFINLTDKTSYDTYESEDYVVIYKNNEKGKNEKLIEWKRKDSSDQITNETYDTSKSVLVDIDKFKSAVYDTFRNTASTQYVTSSEIKDFGITIKDNYVWARATMHYSMQNGDVQLTGRGISFAVKLAEIK